MDLLESVSIHFAELPDPRRTRSIDHPLQNILFIALCASLGGADDWVAVELFAQEHSEFFERFLDMSRGVPSHDTFGRTFSLLDHDRFNRCFVDWMCALAESIDGEVVALDGKTMRSSFDAATGSKALHVVSAYATAQGLSLGQLVVDDKENEIVVLPELIDMLELEGRVVTVDAMGCQKAIAAAIRGAGAHYILRLKENHPRVLREMKEAFEEASEPGSATRCVEHEHWDKGHGRIEGRQLRAFERLGWFEDLGQWEDLESVVEVVSTRMVGEQESVEKRYYLSSLPAQSPQDAAKLNASIRAHWGIENQVHWVLDVSMGEDASRIRKGAGPENMALLRKLALNMHRLDGDSKDSMRSRMRRVMMNPARHVPRIMARASRL